MSAYLFYSPRFRPLSAAGAILPGAKLTFYDTGTTTKTDVYADDALSTPLSNPVVADAAGEFAAIYLDPATTYRVQLHDDDDVLQWDIDPLAPPRDYPAGTIVMFHGTVAERDAAYPSALWQVCDGTNGSPDLRDRMPIGAGTTYASGDTGGTNAATSSAAGGHDHGGAAGAHALTEAEMPTHHHDLWSDTDSVDTATHGLGSGVARSVAGRSAAVANSFIENSGATADQLVSDEGGGSAHDHSISSVADHQHSVTVDPPRCAVWFLMRKSS